MISEEMTCFKAYDIRGEVGKNIDKNIVYKIGAAVSRHFNAKNVVVGYDTRETSVEYFNALKKAITDCGSNVLSIGLAGTEEVYWAVTQYSACAGIEITASHNPINFNGLKIVKANSKPLDFEKDWQKIKSFAESQNSFKKKEGKVIDIKTQARTKYVEKVLSFVDINCFKSYKVIVNSGNGVAGPTFDAIEKQLQEEGSTIDFIKINHKPDSKFPNGVPNPALVENHPLMEREIKKNKADLGIAFDGDFDRCFFFDECGNFVPGEYVVGLFSELFLQKELGAKIVHDPRVVFNIRDIVKLFGGIPIQASTGHSFMKKFMRDNNAIYGGEISAHHYFRDFAFCDSGMLPCLLMIEYLSKTGTSLSKLLKKRRKKFQSSGEINFTVKEPDLALRRVFKNFENIGVLDTTDGMSLSFGSWRFNLRKSNTESLLRLNVETITGLHNIDKLVGKIKELIY